ncbi:conserved hypothetical protein [Candidatus Desulfosporosinus infrequens]|uniref:Uncharacterized protein n=1 Tax=Candidatus Desulfosporosinus infrequens TaxID=2043169 RepID=A0A2U3L8V3_9FIRM|nr:conserved hypothetical protein [Candidatus Desulfosporosinus infrequens]
MSIPMREKVIAKLQEHIGVNLHQFQKKHIFYNGKLADGRGILVCTPQSMLYPSGHGWVNLTIKQVSMLDEADVSILAFRLQGNKVYYLNFCDLKSYLTAEAMYSRDRKGGYWILHIWPKYIQILRNIKRLEVKPNNLKKLGVHCLL